MPQGNTERNPHHRGGAKYWPDKLGKQAAGETHRRHLRQEGRREDIAEPCQAVAPDQTPEIRGQQQRLRRGTGAMKLARARQVARHQRNQHQRQYAVDLPCRAGRQGSRLNIDRQQATQGDAGPGSGKDGCTKPRLAQLPQPLVGPGGNQHHRPAAHAADHKAQQAVNDSIICRRREQRQRHRASDAKPEARFNEAMSAHSIPCPHQIAQVVHCRHQPRAGERELPGGNHQRHLRREGEAPYPHRHDQNHKSAERDTQRHDRSNC